MAGKYCIHWRVEPAFPPRPIRYCATCGRSRAFRSSGKARLNANGRRLDAWLIYKCDSCDRTWNLPLMERATVASVDADLLTALQQSDPVWIRQWEHDIALLGRFAEQIDIPADVLVTAESVGLPKDWSELALVIETDFVTGLRLDRLLARQLGLARAELQAMCRAGALVIEGGSDRVLRKPLRGRVKVRLVAVHLGEARRKALTLALRGE